MLALADEGIAALDVDSHLAAGLNVHLGNLVHPAVIEVRGISHLLNKIFY